MTQFFQDLEEQVPDFQPGSIAAVVDLPKQTGRPPHRDPVYTPRMQAFDLATLSRIERERGVAAA